MVVAAAAAAGSLVGGCVTVGSRGRELPSIEESCRWSQGMELRVCMSSSQEHRG